MNFRAFLFRSNPASERLRNWRKNTRTAAQPNGAEIWVPFKEVRETLLTYCKTQFFYLPFFCQVKCRKPLRMLRSSWASVSYPELWTLIRVCILSSELVKRAVKNIPCADWRFCVGRGG